MTSDSRFPYKIPVTVKNVVPLSMRAAVSTANPSTRTVDVVWTTGAPVLRSNWIDGPFMEELSMDPKHVRMGRLNSGAPFLANHDSSDVGAVLGVVESARLEGSRGVATVRFAAEGIDPEADKIFRKIADGVIRNVSVGYRTWAMTQVSDGEIPTFRAVDWEPFELSAVSIGADASAGFRSAVSTNPCEVNRGLPHVEAVKMSEEIQKQDEAKRAAELKAATEAAVAAERERVMSIRTVVQAAKLDPAVADKLVADGVSIDKARAFAIDELAKRDAATSIENHVRVTGVEGGDSRDKWVRGVSAGAFQKYGNGVVEIAKKRGVNGFENVDLDGGEFRGMTLVDMARSACERNGVSTRGVFDRRRIFELTMNNRASSGDFAILLENVMHKTLRAAYATQEDTWRRFCGTDTVPDFRDSHRYLTGSFGTLPVVGENEEYRNAEIPDGSKVSIQTETRGQIINLSRQALMNDDLGALLATVMTFGRSAGRSIEKAVYDLIALNSGLGPTMSDSQPFFHSNRANVNATGSSLTVAGLDADRAKMRMQMDPDSNDYLDLNPAILLVPVGLESAAKVLNESAYDHTNQDLQKPNAVRGMFNDIVSSPRLGTGTRRYLFTAGKEAFKVVFLEGAGEGPRLESQDGFRVDGTEWKVSIDFKVVPFDPKHAMTNSGQ